MPQLIRWGVMLYRENKRATRQWLWIVRWRRTYTIHRLQLLSLSFFLLASGLVVGDYTFPLAALQKPIVSSPPVEIFPTLSEDQLEQTDSLASPWQMLPLYPLWVKLLRWVRPPHSWVLLNNDALTLARVLTIRQDRSPPPFAFVPRAL